MPLRSVPIFQQNRPSSAIYIGNGTLSTSVSSNTSSTTSSTLTYVPPTSKPAHRAHARSSSSSSVPPGLPDLPEPPSPVLSNSSISSGLPSPPGTNSTGSGSTGDPGTIAFRRHTSASDSRTMLNGPRLKKTSPRQELNSAYRSHSRLSHHNHDTTMERGQDGEYDPERDLGGELLDEDSTARLRLGGSAVLGRHTTAAAAASSESIAALQRVKSLAEKNRLALDKLTSMARLASPIPSSSSNRHLRTTMPSKPPVTSPVHSSSQTPSSRPSSSARSERVRARISLPPPVTPSSSQEQVLSGSETERESTLSSLYTNHANNSSPSMTHSLSTISSSSSSSQEFNNTYGTSHAHIPTHQPPTNNLPYQTPQQQLSKTDKRANHHRISSLASASVSTPHLPSSTRVFQTPPSQAQPLVKTRSTGTTSVTSTNTSASRSASLNRRLTLASTSSGSGSSHPGNLADGSAKSKEDSSTSGSSPRRRRRGGSGSALIMEGLAMNEEERGGEGRVRDETRARMKKRNTGENDVAQAALAAVASSRSRNSLDMRRRNALPREFRRDVDEDEVDRNNYAVDPVTPYRTNSSAGQLRNHDRDVLASTHDCDLGREPEERQRGKPQGIRGGSAESALASRGPANTGVAGGKRDEAPKVVGPRNRRLDRERERERRDLTAGSSDVFGNARVDWSPEEEKMPVSEFGERTKTRERELGLAGPRSATSLSQSSYSSRRRSRTRTGEASFSDEDDEDNGDTREDVTRTAPAGLRAYQVYSTPRETKHDIVHLSLMKNGRRERERERGDKDMITGRSMTSLSRYSTPVHQNGSSSSAVPSALPQQDKHNAVVYSGRRGSIQVLLNHTGSTAGGDSERAVSRQSNLSLADRTEHARLMHESLSMFEGHIARISSCDGLGLGPVHVAELVKTAQSVVSSADRLNGLLRAASKNAVEQEIDAEVADDVEAGESGGRGGSGTATYSARDMVQVWKSVHGDYKEGVKASNELIRGITGFLLGIGKVLRDIGSVEGGAGHVACMNSVGSGSTHARSVSLNDEDIIRSTRGSSPATSGGRSVSGATGRRSADMIKKGWEPSPSVAAAAIAREDAYRRLTGRLDGTQGARTSPPVLSREQVQDTRYESPQNGAHDSAFTTPAPPRSSTSLSSRRLLIPREQREREHEARLSRLSLSEDLVGSTSQDTIVPYEPSPTPAPRVRDGTDKNKSLPSLNIPKPKPLPSLPSDSSRYGTPEYGSLSETSTSTRGHERRKASNTSISTVRGASTYPAALNPSGGGATTAVTAHTVSNASPDVTPTSSTSSLTLGSGSRRSIRSCVTFSKPSTESVPTLAGLQQHYEERQRTSETKAVYVSDHAPSTPMSGSETERPPKRQTWGTKTGLAAKGKPASDVNNVSVVDGHGRVSLGRAADRSAASSLLPHVSSARRERKNVAELFPKS